MSRLLLLVFALFTAPSSLAFYSTVDDGKILEEGRYRLTGTGQLITSEGSGGNATGRFAHWWNDELQVEALAGFGDVDFQAGGFVKWVPIPDFDNQPAVGVKAGALYGSVDGLNEFSFRIHPLVSKAFNSDIGQFTPYASLPIGVRFFDNQIDLPTQVVAGSFFEHAELQNISFALELGVDLNKAFNYITLGVALEVDESEGIVIK